MSRTSSPTAGNCLSATAPSNRCISSSAGSSRRQSCSYLSVIYCNTFIQAPHLPFPANRPVGGYWCVLSGFAVLSACCLAAGFGRLEFCLFAVGMQVTSGCRSVGVPSGRQKRVRVVIWRAALLRKRAFSFPAHPHSSHPATPEARNSGAAAETRPTLPHLRPETPAPPPQKLAPSLPHLRPETPAPQQKLAPPCHT